MRKYFKWIPLLVIVLSAVCMGRSYITASANEALEDVIPATVYIGETDVSGMTAEEAVAAMQQEVS